MFDIEQNDKSKKDGDAEDTISGAAEEKNSGGGEQSAASSDSGDEENGKKKAGAGKKTGTLAGASAVPAAMLAGGAAAGAAVKLGGILSFLQVLWAAIVGIAQAVVAFLGTAVAIVATVAVAAVGTFGIVFGLASGDASVMRDNMRYVDCHEMTSYLFHMDDESATAAKRMAIAAALYSVLASEGASPAEAAGIIGNFVHESGLDPYSVETIFDEPWRIGERKEQAWAREFYIAKYNYHGFAQVYGDCDCAMRCSCDIECAMSCLCDGENEAECDDGCDDDCYEHEAECDECGDGCCEEEAGCGDGCCNMSVPPGAAAVGSSEDWPGDVYAACKTACSLPDTACCAVMDEEKVPCLCADECGDCRCQWRGGIGLGQWSGGRNVSLRAFANANFLYWHDYHLQIAFLLKENYADFIGEMLGSGMTSEEASTWFLLNWEQPKGVEPLMFGSGGYTSEETARAEAMRDARAASAAEWEAVLETTLANYEYAKGVLELADRGTSIANRTIRDNWAKDCGSLMHNVDGSTIAEMASAYAWPSVSDASNDGTDLFRAAANMVHPSIVTYQACDIAVSTAIRWSGADFMFPTHSTAAQYKYMNRGEGRYKWSRIGLMDVLLLEGGLWPGDVILATSYEMPGTATGHVEMYAGRDAVKKYHPGSDDNKVVVAGSLYTHSPAIKSVPPSPNNYRIYRLAYYGPVHLSAVRRRGNESVSSWPWYNYNVVTESAMGGISMPGEWVPWQGNFNTEYEWVGCGDEFPVPEGISYSDHLSYWLGVTPGGGGWFDPDPD